MSVRSAQSITTEFTTRSPSTGAASDADSPPTGTLYVNGTANGATVTVTNQATGKYKAAVTLPTLAVGDVVSILIAATVESISDNGKIWEDSKDVFAGAIPDVIAGGASGLVLTSAVPTAAAIAAAVEAAILNEGDATALLAAIAAKVEAFLINEGDATATLAAIATAVRANLATELARIDAAITTRATPAQVATELATYDAPTHAEMTSELAALATSTALASLVTTVGVAGIGLSAIPKTGYKLASDGLDSVAVTAPAGVASTFPGMVVQLWRRFFRKSTLTATQLKTYGDDGTTVLTTQVVSDDSTTQTQGTSS